MSYLLDTCVISELVSARPAPVVLEWMNSVETTRLFLSVLTIGEIKRGIVRLPASKRRSALESWLEQDLSLRFHGRILSFLICATVRASKSTGTSSIMYRSVTPISGWHVISVILSQPVYSRYFLDQCAGSSTLVTMWRFHTAKYCFDPSSKTACTISR